MKTRADMNEEVKAFIERAKKDRDLLINLSMPESSKENIELFTRSGMELAGQAKIALAIRKYLKENP